MFTFTDKEVGSLLTDEKCFNDLYDLYYDYQYKNKLVLVLKNQIAYELPLKMISVKWAVACTERCLHIFEEERPNDNRPRLAIEAARQWIIDPTINTDHAHAAAAHAAHAARAANAANTDAAAANAASAASAAYAAYAAYDVHNTNVASYAACAAVRAAYAASASDAAAAAVEQEWSRNKLIEIVGEYLNDYRRDLKNTLVRVNIILELSDIIIKYVI